MWIPAKFINMQSKFIPSTEIQIGDIIKTKRSIFACRIDRIKPLKKYIVFDVTEMASSNGKTLVIMLDKNTPVMVNRKTEQSGFHYFDNWDGSRKSFPTFAAASNAAQSETGVSITIINDQTGELTIVDASGFIPS